MEGSVDNKMKKMEGTEEERTLTCQQVNELVEAFEDSREDGQLQILDNGGWFNLNEWLKFSLSTKDVPLVKRILNLLMTMPTSFTQLMQNKGGLPLTVEKLLQFTAWRKVKIGGEEETDEIKLLCAGIFARWLLIKKESQKEIQGNQSLSLTESYSKTGEVEGVLTKIKDVNGLKTPSSLYEGTAGGEGSSYDVKMVEVTSVDKHLEKMDTEDNSQTKVPQDPNRKRKLEQDDDMTLKSSRPRNIPKVFCTSKSRQETLLEDMIVSASQSSSKSLSRMNAAPAAGPSSSSQLTGEQKLVTDPKKVVRFWGSDGVRSVEYFDADENDYNRSGLRKEKWLSVDFYDDFEEENGEVPADRQMNQVEIRIQRILQRISIPFENKRRPVNSKEQMIQQLRESMVPQFILRPGKIMPDCPAEVEGDPEYLEENDEDEKFKMILFEDIIGRPMERDNTEVYNHQQEGWAAPKYNLIV